MVKLRPLVSEIDENLARSELTEAQRAQAHARREEIMVSLGLVSKLGDNQHTRGSDNLSNPPSYARQAAGSLGVDERTVRRDLARGKKIDPEILAEVQGTEHDKGVVLDELARTPQVDQRGLCEAGYAKQVEGPGGSGEPGPSCRLYIRRVK